MNATPQQLKAVSEVDRNEHELGVMAALDDAMKLLAYTIVGDATAFRIVRWFNDKYGDKR